MTEPELALEQMAPELIGTGAQAVVDNAKRLGLTWTLRLATVINSSNLAAVSAIYDGDTVAIDMTSMIGVLGPGQRVYVIGVPPSGNYIVGLVLSPWIRPTLLNSWVNFDAGYQVARFRKTSAGQVEIQGLVKNGTGPPAVIFTLPTGYRPALQLIFAVLANPSVLADLGVEADGDVVWNTGGNNSALALNCTFSPD